MTNNDTATKATSRLAPPAPKKEDFAPFNFAQVDRSKNHRRGTPARRKVRTIL